MNRIIWIYALTAIAITACTGINADPYQTAVENAIKFQNPEITNLYISEFTMIDSVDCAREIDRCADVFRAKRDVLATSAYKFRTESKQMNASIKEKEALEAERIMNAILDLKITHSESLDSTLYYCFRISGDFKTNAGGRTSFSDWYATVGTDYRTYNIQKGKKGILKGMGAALPWYEETIKSFGTEAEAQD